MSVILFSFCHFFPNIAERASFTDFSFVPYNIDINSCRVMNKLGDNDQNILFLYTNKHYSLE